MDVTITGRRLASPLLTLSSMGADQPWSALDNSFLRSFL